MRRILTDPLDYLVRLGRAVAAGWDRFFFTPADPTPLGVIRAITGALIFWNLCVYGMDLERFFGPDGWVPLAALESLRPPGMDGIWSFWFHVPDAWLRPVWALCLVVAACMTVGLFSRTASILGWVIVVSTVRRATPYLFGFDQILSTLALYVAVTGASGQAFSLDRFLARRRAAAAEMAARRGGGIARWPLPSGVPAPTVSANLALRLIQIHLCVIYGMSGFAKLRGEMWWEGVAVWPTWIDREFTGMDLTWMADHLWAVNLATFGTLFVEIAYPFLIWSPLLAPILLATVIAMHLGIGVSLGLVEFATAMIAMNIAFFSGAWLRGLVAGRAAEPRVRVLYDGACPRCRASMAWLSAADPARCLEPIDLTAVDPSKIDPRLDKARCMAAMHVLDRENRVFRGYDACVRVADWIPLAWPLALLGRVPGVATLGRRVYNRIAATRPRDAAPCVDDVCAVPPPRSIAAGKSKANPKAKAGATGESDNRPS